MNGVGDGGGRPNPIWLDAGGGQGRCPALVVAMPSPGRASCSRQRLSHSSRRHLQPEERHDDEAVQNEDCAMRLVHAEAVVVMLVGARWPWEARP